MRVVDTGEQGLVRPITKFWNCLVLKDHDLVDEELWISGGKIINPEHLFYNEKILPDRVVDCGGAIASPGFIDIQLNGNDNKSSLNTSTVI